MISCLKVPDRPMTCLKQDGTDKITFVHPDDFTPIKQLTVTENGSSRDYLNELEYINGFIYANIWMQAP